MKKQDKIFEVQNLSAKIKDAKAIAVADFRGITVNQITQLRDKIREAGGELQVAKNNLLCRALRENKYEVKKDDFQGTNITLFANVDEILPLKALTAFGKTLSLLPLKMGFMAGNILSADELNRFASLPPKIELRAKLVGMLASQPSRLIRSLNYNLQKLVIALGQIKSQKQN